MKYERLKMLNAAVWENIAGVFRDFQWPIVLVFLMLAVMMYMVIRTLYENSAKWLIAVYVFFVVISGVAALFWSAFSGATYFLFVSLVSAFFLLVFSIEIKRGIYKGPQQSQQHHHKETAASKAKASASVLSADECIAGIVKAVQNLSKNNIGALIVLSNGNMPKEIVGSGVALNAQISSQLIEGIFIPKAPLHDGAMIIYGDKIQAAGCFLPLTQRDFPKDYGTRHRAGIGVTEVVDVSTIIVSEETGIVSVVRRGDITRYVDSESLKRFLRDYYWKKVYAEKK